MVKSSINFILKLSRICGLMGCLGPLSFPKLTSKDGQLVFKPNSSSYISSKGSTSIRVPKVSSTSSGAKFSLASHASSPLNSLRFPSVAKSSNYEVTREEKAKRRNFRTKMKTFEESTKTTTIRRIQQGRYG
ncbi:hypothetical protein Tco_0664224, partial [Tanacetum coccineum]